MELANSIKVQRAERDLQLVERARDHGDERAFADLMSIYREPLYVMLLKMINDPVVAEDLTIEALGKAFCSLKHYSPTNSFSTWLFSIASNNCIDYMRRRRNAPPVYFGELTTWDDGENTARRELNVPSDSGNPEDDLVRDQRIEMLREVIKQLKPHYRMVVELRYFEELSYEEISDRLGLPIGSVKSRLFRAHDFLYKILSTRKDF